MDDFGGPKVIDVGSIMLPLFVPADRPERFSKASGAKPDAVIIDLEDAVAPVDKSSASALLPNHLASMQFKMPLLLRINAVDTPWHEHDLQMARDLPLSAIILPKAETVDAIRRVKDQLGLPVVALIETARGLAAINPVASVASRIAFGSIDFAVDLAMEHTRISLHMARSLIVQVSRLAGLPAPLDGVTIALDDVKLLRDDCAHAVEMGFGGKLLIHPAQIKTSREAFAPSAAQIAWARRILTAAESGRGVVKVDGAMIDAPLVARARQIEARTAGCGGKI